MPRFLAILKYVPAALCGLLVVAWVVSLFVSIQFSANTRDHELTCAVANGSLLYIDIQMNPSP